jgi:glycosyltransferase involved in cell wall biosynthesis
VKIAYLFAQEGRAVLRSTGHAVHIQELCGAFRHLGHDVVLLTGKIGEGGNGAVELPRTIEVGPRVSLPRRARGGRFERAAGAPPRKGRRRLRPAAKDAARICWWAVRNELVYRRCRRALAHEAPDLIYERYVAGSTVGARLARALRTPLIVEMNASFTFPEEWWSAHTRLYVDRVRRIERLVAERADAVVVVSTRLRDHLLSLDIPEKKVTVLYNGADVTRFRPDVERAREVRRAHRLDGSLVVGFIGSLKPWHGLDLLLKSARTVLDGDADIRWLVVGNGPLLESLKELARREGLEPAVQFAGAVPRDAAPAYIGAMDIAVAPAPRLENYHFSPIKIFEYMASGRAVVAPRYPDIERVIRHRENGLLVDPGDHEQLAEGILELARDRDLRIQLGAEARRTVESSYTWRRNAQVVVALADEIRRARGA